MHRIARGRIAAVGVAVILGLVGLLTVPSGFVGAKSSGPIPLPRRIRWYVWQQS